MSGQEPYGTTPLPIPVVDGGSNGSSEEEGSVLHVLFDPSEALEVAQQPQSQQIALFEAPPCDDYFNGSRLDVNQHFVVYAVKNGLIRVLHRHSTLRTLLRGHEGQRVTDISFFHDGDVLGTVGFSPKVGAVSSVIIWRVYERSPEIMSEKLLEIPTTKFSINRMIFHPFNPNQFWIIHSSTQNSVASHNEADGQHVATLVDTTRISTVPHDKDQHSVCQFHNDVAVMEGAKQVAVPDSSLTDLAWSERDPRHVMTTHRSGHIILWDLKNIDTNDIGDVESGLIRPVRLTTLKEDKPVTRCLFLPHENSVKSVAKNNSSAAANDRPWTSCFCTGAQNNSSFTIWSPFSEHSSPTKLQVISMANPAPSYLLAVCFGPAPADASPPSSFLVLADRSQGSIFAFHVQSKWNERPQEAKQPLAVGCDYVVPFTSKYPIFSWSVVCVPTTDISEEDLNEQGGLIFDMKLFSYQSQVVQALTLTSYMCLPPETSWTDATPGVIVEEQRSPSSAISDDVIATEPIVYDEDYDVEDDGDVMDDEFPQGPAASSLPPPSGFEFGEFVGLAKFSTEPLKSSADGKSASQTDAAEISKPSSSNGAVNSNNAMANWLGAFAAKPVDGQEARDAISMVQSPGLLPKTRLPPDSALSPIERMPPPPPPPTPASTGKPLSTSNNIPSFPGIDDPAIVGIGSPPQITSPFLSPVEMLARNVTSLEDKPPASSGDAPQSPGDSKKRNKAAKKEKGKPYNPKTPQAAPTPNHEGKISILKRDENILPTILSANGAANSVPLPPAIPVSTPTENLEEIINKVLTAHSKKQHAFLVSEIQRAVRSEIETTVVPALSKAVQQTVDQSVLAPIKADLAKMKQSVRDHKVEIVEAVSAGVEEPLQTAFTESLKNVLIPAFESVTARMFTQIATAVDKNLSSVSENNNSSKQDIEQLSASMANIADSVEKLSSQMEEMKVAIASQGAADRKPPGLASPSQVDKLQSKREEVVKLLNMRQYENAFIQALSASTADIAVFCCEQVKISDVLGNDKPALSQPILLCLMQQLGAALVTSTSPQKLHVEVTWLQEIALILDPTDRKIAQHVPNVLNELVTNVTMKMANGDQSFRRPLEVLLRVIRGMQMG